MFDFLPYQYARLMPAAVLLFVWLGVLMAFTWFQQRRIQARFAGQISETNAQVEASRRLQEEAEARASESFAMQRRGMEIAEQSLRVQEESLELLRRIAENLESRPKA